MNELIIFCAKYVVFLVVLGLAVAWLLVKKQLKWRFVVATILAGIIAFVLSRIASHLFYSPRPFVSEHIKPLIEHAPDNGFPSDHALFTSTLTAITFFFEKRTAAVMAVLTLLVCLSRILAHVHSPIDIIGGVVIGVGAAVASYYLTNWVFGRLHKQKAE